MQVQLSATAKANSGKAGADIKESGLFAGASHLEDRKVTSHSPPSGKWGTHVTKPTSTAQCRQRVFVRRERETEQRDQGRGLQSSLRAGEHSPF